MPNMLIDVDLGRVDRWAPLSVTNFRAMSNGRVDILSSVTILDAYEYATGFRATSNPRPGDRYMVLCPSANHKERNPSCSLNCETRSWRCFACGAKGGILDLIIANGAVDSRRDAIAWLARMKGLPARDYRDQPKAVDGRDPDAKLSDEIIRSVHDYVDEHGELVSQILRIEGRREDGARGKRFSQRAPIAGDRKWTYDLRQTRTVLYRLPLVLAGAAAGRTIFVTEGELKADVLVALGFVATTSANGANFQWPLEWASHFAGARHVVILADSDDHGRRSALRKKALLESPERSVEVIDFFPDRSDGSDLFEWMRERGFEPFLERMSTSKKISRPIAHPLAKLAAETIKKVTKEILSGARHQEELFITAAPRSSQGVRAPQELGAMPETMLAIVGSLVASPAKRKRGRPKMMDAV